MDTMIKIKIISKEHIKPSSPTPTHKQSFNLSIFDQLIPAPYAPIILYYPNQDSTFNNLDHDHDHHLHERLENLKDSLSKTLTLYYPLAGTVKDDLSIDCNDVGACFTVARVDTSLDGFLNNLEMKVINGLLPCAANFNGGCAGMCVTNVQVNVFDCCGIAIGLCISHKIVDGASMSSFLKAWSDSSFGSKMVVKPNLCAASVFPAHDLWLKDSSLEMWGSFLKMGPKSSTRRFVFDSSKLAILKAEAVRNGMKDPTRVEVVSALLWKCTMAASQEKVGSFNPSLLTHVVNLRKRFGPSYALSKNSIGNLVWIASAECRTESELGLSDLVARVRDGISQIDSEFVKKLHEGREMMEESIKRLKDCGTKDGMDYFGVTSWCKMGFYEVDFGWGKPIWVCGSVVDGSPVVMNFVILMDTRFGDGIEAWVNIDEHEMRILEKNPELMAFASLDPSPLRKNE